MRIFNNIIICASLFLLYIACPGKIEEPDRLNPDDPQSSLHIDSPQLESDESTVITGNYFTISWNAIEGANEYMLEESKTTDFSTLTDTKQYKDSLSGTTDTTFIQTKIEEPTTYYYRIKAKSGNVESKWSSLLSILIEPLPVPTLESSKNSSLSGEEYIISWANTDGTKRYFIEEYLGSISGSPVKSQETDSTHWKRGHSVSSPTDYIYRIKSKNDYDESDWSQAITINICRLQAPVFNDPGNSVFPGENYIISWDSVTYAEQYVFEEAEDSLFNQIIDTQELISPKSNPIHHSIEINKKYFYRVKSKNSTGDSEWSNTISKEVRQLNSPVVDPGTDVLTGVKYTITWNDVEKADSYTIEEYTNSYLTQLNDSVTISVSQKDFQHDVNSSKIYYYHVLAKNSFGLSQWSNVVTVKVNALSMPEIKDIGGDVSSGVTFTIEWNTVDGAKKYVISERTNINGAQNPIDTTSSSLSISRTKYVDQDSIYYYSVKAIKDSVESGWSIPVSKKVLKLSTPVLKDPANEILTGSYFNISWNEIEGATEYKVKEWNENTPNQSEEFPAPGPIYETTINVTKTTTYYYQVKALNQYSESDWSEPIDINIIVSSLKLIQPNGNETYVGNSNKIIKWDGKFIDKIALMYSLDFGKSWTDIDNNVLFSENEFVWTVPDTSSSNCLVKIIDESDSLVYDQSDAVFTIVPEPKITVTYPNGGESIPGDTTISITWTSENVSTVKVEYTLDGLKWEPDTTLTSINATLGTVSWLVPDTSSNNSKIKLIDISNSTVYDQSDSSFTIIASGSSKPFFSTNKHSK